MWRVKSLSKWDWVLAPVPSKNWGILEVDMGNIKVGRYSNPETRKFWQGWIEPEDLSWIMFIDVAGKPTVFLDRDPITGAVR